MPDFRVYCQPSDREPAELRLNAEESHHLVTVNRCSRGDQVIAFDGRGREWITECIEPSKNATVLKVREIRQAKSLSHEITLAQAMPKGSTMDDIVRQATEIGAAHIVPLFSERTQIHLDGDRADKKVDKWRTVSIEAAKQCGNPWLPEISPIQNFAAFISSMPSYDLKLVASLHAGTTALKTALKHHRDKHSGNAPRKVVWLVGPEGDFSPAEITTAITAGFQPITLGPLVLRSDTAAIYALSILSNELQGG
jgi:16S rRNA (uracil1498-N3)-methyltransferase